MSGWTEYLIADKRDANAIAEENNPNQRWPGFEGFKFFGPSHLAPLYQALGRESATWREFPELAYGNTGWVYELPPEMVTALRNIREDRIPEMARAWGSRLAAIGERYSGEELASFLGQMRHVAVQAGEAGKPVLLWQSSTG